MKRRLQHRGQRVLRWAAAPIGGLSMLVGSSLGAQAEGVVDDTAQLCANPSSYCGALLTPECLSQRLGAGVIAADAGAAATASPDCTVVFDDYRSCLRRAAARCSAPAETTTARGCSDQTAQQLYNDVDKSNLAQLEAFVTACEGTPQAVMASVRLDALKAERDAAARGEPRTQSDGAWIRQFDGRVGRIRVSNPTLYAFKITLWHPDNDAVFGTWELAGQTDGYLQADGTPFNIGNDWGIQFGDAPARSVGEATGWDGKEWRATPGDFFN
ncbi:MAG: hypothetical protein AAFV62_05205 [Pseudomonadota bacterium]